MEPSKKPVQGELQSKTVILSENTQAEKLLDALRQDASRPVPAHQRIDWLAIAIIALLLLVAVEVLWILLR